MIGAVAFPILLFVGSPTAAPSKLPDWLDGPDVEDFRTQPIKRQSGETGWPFAHDQGMLFCAISYGRRVGGFQPTDPDGRTPDNVTTGIILSYDPLQMVAIYSALSDLFQPIRDPADLIRRTAPYTASALRLCDQPKGATVPAGEL